MNDRVSAFTLIELLIAMAIVGIIAVLVIPNLLASQKRAFDSSAISCAKSLQTVQAISQVDNSYFKAIGPDTNQINHTTDGIDHSCRQNDIFIVDRSDSTSLSNNYIFDIWSKKGGRVITVTPSFISGDVAGATPFSSDGSGGSNLP